ncbi:MAG TPA: bifunctional nicotinamidase/pyrazinamidase [Alloacidobacterium sp.]|nr:bifunctional nicotinamidase/pyrazinamidase [Alloacidobacterium sp.]
MPMKITERDALLVIDVQNDFCPGGALAVPRGDEVVPVINRWMQLFPHVVLTQDWHPPDHLSFASSHAGHEPFATVTVTYGEQTLWPHHCVQGTQGAEFHPELDTRRAALILRKGFRREIDSYSAFQENDRRTKTGLAGYLRERGIERVFVAGLAYDYCVRYSAVDARSEGFETVVIADACRGIGLGKSMEVARNEMLRNEVVEITTEDFLI